VLRDSAIVAACGLEDMELDEHPDLLVAALRYVLRSAGPAASTSTAIASHTRARSTHGPRLVAEAAARVLAELGRALPGLAASTPAFLREQALSLAAVIEPAPPSQGPLPTVVRLGRAPLDVLLVLSGVKRQELLLPGVAPIQLREDYSA
jgi:hypothetical protein